MVGWVVEKQVVCREHQKPFAAEMVVQAKDPLELEDAHVVQELITLFNGRPEVISKLVALVQGKQLQEIILVSLLFRHQYIVDKLTELRKEKFPAPSDEDFCLSDNPNPPPSFSNFGSGPVSVRTHTHK